jgi:hypothetical protein
MKVFWFFFSKKNIFLLLLPLAACAPSRPAASPRPPPMDCPAVPLGRPPTHPAPKPPVTATPLTLEPGHWDWDGHDYLWVSPEWVRRLSDRPMWLAGHWTQNGGACVWNPGHFIS